MTTVHTIPADQETFAGDEFEEFRAFMEALGFRYVRETGQFVAASDEPFIVRTEGDAAFTIINQPDDLGLIDLTELSAVTGAEGIGAPDPVPVPAAAPGPAFPPLTPEEESRISDPFRGQEPATALEMSIGSPQESTATEDIAAALAAQGAGGDPSGAPLASGLDALRQEFEMLIIANQERRAEADFGLRENQDFRAQQQQQFEFASLFGNLVQQDPITAINFAFGLGLPLGNPFADVFGALTSGQALPNFGGLPETVPFFLGGEIADLPTSFTGRQLDTITGNPLLQNVLERSNQAAGITGNLSRAFAARQPAGALPGVNFG